MIKLRPWKGTKNEFEADIIVNGPNGRTLRKRVKVPVSGKSNAERWAHEVEEYRPYSDDGWAHLRQELSKYNIDDATFEQIVATLEL